MTTINNTSSGIITILTLRADHKELYQKIGWRVVHHHESGGTTRGGAAKPCLGKIYVMFH